MAQLPVMRLRGHVSHILQYVFWSTLITCIALTFTLHRFAFYYYLFIYCDCYDSHLWLDSIFLLSVVFQQMTVKLNLICSIVLCSPAHCEISLVQNPQRSNVFWLALIVSRLGLGIKNLFQFQNQILKVRNWILVVKLKFRFCLSIPLRFFFFSLSVRTRPSDLPGPCSLI